MTEMEELKRNTEIEFQKQRRDSLLDHLDMLGAHLEERDRWHERARSLEFFCLLFYWSIILLFAWQNNTSMHAEITKEFAFILFLVTCVRSMTLMGMWMKALGELKGAVDMLSLLGGFKNEMDQGKKKKIKRRGLFARYKEFWERMGSDKKKEVENSSYKR